LFLLRDAIYAERGYATVRRLSVCPSLSKFVKVMHRKL